QLFLSLLTLFCSPLLSSPLLSSQILNPNSYHSLPSHQEILRSTPTLEDYRSILRNTTN
ncbi:hypothetical protein SOVF_198100, partial [Spinacia oleracea]